MGRVGLVLQMLGARRRKRLELGMVFLVIMACDI